MLPEGWKILKLVEVGGGTKNAIVDGPFGSNLKSEHYRESGIPVFQSGFVTKGKFYANSYVYVDEELFKQQKRSTAVGGDILMAKIGAYAGRCALIPANHPTGILAGNSVKITVETTLHCSEYIQILLAYRYDCTGLSEIKTETAQPAISLKNLKALKIKVPPLIVQQKIAEILGTWDQAIETLEALIANSQAQKKALMQQLLTGKRRLLGFKNDWKSYELQDIAQVIMGSSPKSSSYNEEGKGLPLIQGNADIKEHRSRPRQFTEEVTQRCYPGDILISVRAPVGEIAYSEHEACIGRGIASVRPKETRDKWFVYFTLLNGEEVWLRLAQGSTFQAIGSADLKSFPLFCPSSVKERDAIANVLVSIEIEESLLQRQLELLITEKAALMQQLLTGKRRVNLSATPTTQKETIHA